MSPENPPHSNDDEPPAAPTTEGTPPELRILYQDEHIVAISKPSGMLVHKSERSPDQIVVLQTLAAQIDKFLYPVHRLDRGTSGVLVFALAKKAAARLQKALSAESASKEYLALTRWPQHVFPLEDRWESRRALRNADGEPKSAHSEFEVVEHIGHFALVRARIHTGRNQQIRRHLNHCARHVIGDTTHGKGRINQMFRKRFGLDRLFLHAERLRIAQPMREDHELTIVDPLPDELHSVLDRLRDHNEVDSSAEVAP